MINVIKTFLMQVPPCAPSSIWYTGTSCLRRTLAWWWGFSAKWTLAFGEDSARGDSNPPHVCGLQDESRASCPNAIASLDIFELDVLENEHDHSSSFSWSQQNAVSIYLKNEEKSFDEYCFNSSYIFLFLLRNKYLTYTRL